jgi:hypothetical protein
MRWNIMIASIGLLSLTGAASTPGTCEADAVDKNGLSAPIGGSPSSMGFPTMFTPDNGCGPTDVLPSAVQSKSLANESQDVLHGLTTPDALRRVDEQRQVPAYR